MPNLATWLAFVATALVLLLIPGPAVLYIVSQSVEHGRRAGLDLQNRCELGLRHRHLRSLVGCSRALTRAASTVASLRS